MKFALMLWSALIGLSAVAQPTREFDATWSKGFLKPEQLVEIVYARAANGK